MEQIVDRLNNNAIVKRLNLFESLNKALNQWNQPHRFYHGIKHLEYLFMLISSTGSYSKHDRELLELIALYHDVVYDPRSKRNEELSAQYFMDSLRPLTRIDRDIGIIKGAIVDTSKVLNLVPSSKISQIFGKLDVDVLLHGSALETINNEMLLFKEFQMYDIEDYKRERCRFIVSLMKRKDIPEEDKINLHIIIGFLSSFKPRIGLYCGSFEPFHIGHFNILEKAEATFDKVIIGKGVNPEKQNERHFLVEHTLPFHQHIDYRILLYQLYQQLSQRYDVTIVRGLRNGYDLQYETNLLRSIQDKIPSVKFVYYVCDNKYEHISSTMCRGLAVYDDLESREFARRYYVNKYIYNTGDICCQPVVTVI